MKEINIIFPHQLFRESCLLENKHEIYLIEEYLFFRQYRFHKQKIAFHRASMKAYAHYLKEKYLAVHYIEASNPLSDIRNFTNEIRQKNIQVIHVIDPVDNWLNKRLDLLAEHCTLHTSENPQFLNSAESLNSFFKAGKQSFFQTSFYKQQRKKWGILIDEANNPVGGKWTYDTENRKKYPANKMPPNIQFPGSSVFWEEAVVYTNLHFPENPGQLTAERFYPITHLEADQWFDQFLTFRFFDFGKYEDAILKEYSILHHSVLSPLLNAGLIIPQETIKRSLEFADMENIPINSTEGFIRQIIGWREFIRGMYISKGSYSRTRNFWGFHRKIPSSFYTGTTGIVPFDQTIKKVLKTGYCHHIERLMVLGNFMLLCEFDPDEVYRWFMELFIDAYDWVMVPNVYGMTLFADGGTFATKPYIGGSNYIRKMSNYSRGPWEHIWDGLFWRFVKNHEDFFRYNPRTSMLVHSLQRLPDEKINMHLENANAFLQKI